MMKTAKLSSNVKLSPFIKKLRGKISFGTAGKKLLLGILLLGFVFLTAGCDSINFVEADTQSGSGSGSGGTFTVSGTIVDEDEEPIENAKITTMESDGSAISDSEGNWQLNSLEGEVIIKAVIGDNDNEDYGFDPSEVIASSDREDVNFKARKLDFDDGDGSEDEPYLITRTEQLYDIRFRLDGHYTLGKDIDLGEYDNWKPIGKFIELDHEDNVYFRGTFEGGGYKISGLKVDRPDEKGVGLFAALGSGAEVRNLTLAVDSVTGHEWVGALSGRNLESEISRVWVVADDDGQGQVAGSGLNIGGLVGANRRGTINESLAEVDVVLTGGSQSVHAGGLTGYNNYEIANSYARGNIIFESALDSSSRVGALVGLVHDEDSDYQASITSTYATGEINGSNNGEDLLIGEIVDNFMDAEASYYGDEAKDIDENTSGWDSTIWDFDTGDYPVLNRF